MRPLNSSHWCTCLDTTVATLTSGAGGAAGWEDAWLLQPADSAIAAPSRIASMDRRAWDRARTLRVFMGRGFPWTWGRRRFVAEGGVQRRAAWRCGPGNALVAGCRRAGGDGKAPVTGR